MVHYLLSLIREGIDNKPPVTTITGPVGSDLKPRDSTDPIKHIAAPITALRITKVLKVVM
jgi:hypothetical protein